MSDDAPPMPADVPQRLDGALYLAAPGFEKELYHRLETEREAPRTAKIHYFSKRNIAAAAAVRSS